MAKIKHEDWAKLIEGWRPPRTTYEDLGRVCREYVAKHRKPMHLGDMIRAAGGTFRSDCGCATVTRAVRHDIIRRVAKGYYIPGSKA